MKNFFKIIIDGSTKIFLKLLEEIVGFWQELKKFPHDLRSSYLNFKKRRKKKQASMALGYVIKMSIGNLRTKRLRALLTIGGVVIGISAILFLVSFGFGLENIVISSITHSETYEVIDISTGGSSLLSINDENLMTWSEIPSVKEVVPSSTLPTKIKIGDSQTQGLVQGASEPLLELAEIGAVSGKIDTQGWGLSLSKKGVTLLGKDPDQAIGTKTSIELIIPKILTEEKTENKVVEQTDLEITGVIDDEERVWALVSENLLSEMGVVDSTEAKVRVKPTNQIPIVRKVIESQGFRTDYIGDTIAQINQVFMVLRAALGGFGLIALLVAALGMFNTLTISLLERTREVGLMKAIGIKRRDVYRIFLSEALIIGIIGGTIGVLTGVVLNSLGNLAVNQLAEGLGGEKVILFKTPWWFYFASFAFAFLVGALTGLYPARRAGRIKALDAIRYE